jgi:hypothetical protein
VGPVICPVTVTAAGFDLGAKYRVIDGDIPDLVELRVPGWAQ